MKSTFRRVVVQVEILTDDPTLDFNNMSLSDIDYQIKDGGCSGVVKIISQEKVTGKEMVKLAEAQGTNPEFFGIDYNGKETNAE